MRTLFFVCVLFPFLFAAKCGEKTAPFQLNQEFEMMPGQRMSCDCGDMEITFAAVQSDARCPTGVNCIRAGEAKVLVKVSGSETADVVLEIGEENSTQSTQTVGGYQIRAMKLDPYPIDGKQTKTEDYRLGLRVSKTPNS